MFVIITVVVIAVVIKAPSGFRQKEGLNKPIHWVPRFWVSPSPVCGAWP